MGGGAGGGQTNGGSILGNIFGGQRQQAESQLGQATGLGGNAGQLMAQKTLQNVHAGDKASVALGKVAAGVYHLVANVDGKTSAVKFVAK